MSTVLKPPEHSRWTHLPWHPLAWLKMQFLLDARGHKHEFTFFGIHHPQQPWYVIDFWIPPQRCSGSHTSPDREAIGLWLADNPQQVIYWGHTHPNMGAGPSGDDNDTFNFFTNHDRAVAMMIWARNGTRDKTCKMRVPLVRPTADTQSGVVYVETDLTMEPNGEFFVEGQEPPPPIDFTAILRDLDSKVTPFQYATNNYTQNGVGVYIPKGGNGHLSKRARKMIRQSGGTGPSHPASNAGLNTVTSLTGTPSTSGSGGTGGGMTQSPLGGAVTQNNYYQMDDDEIALAFLGDDPEDPSWQQAAVAFDNKKWEDKEEVNDTIKTYLDLLKLPSGNHVIACITPYRSYQAGQVFYRRAFNFDQYFPDGIDLSSLAGLLPEKTPLPPVQSLLPDSALGSEMFH